MMKFNRATIKALAKEAHFPYASTIEDLEMYFVSYVAVVPYHDYVVVARLHPETEDACSYAIYSFDTDDHSIEAPCTMIDIRYMEYHDMGDAMYHALMLAKALQADKMKGKKV